MKALLSIALTFSFLPVAAGTIFKTNNFIHGNEEQVSIKLLASFQSCMKISKKQKPSLRDRGDDNYFDYRYVCKSKQGKVGSLFMTENTRTRTFHVNFSNF